jgi:hypothetical protein
LLFSTPSLAAKAWPCSRPWTTSPHFMYTFTAPPRLARAPPPRAPFDWPGRELMGLEPLLIWRVVGWCLTRSCPYRAVPGNSPQWCFPQHPLLSSIRPTAWTALFRGWKEVHTGQARSVNLEPKAGTLFPSTTAVWTISGKLSNRSRPVLPCASHGRMRWKGRRGGGEVVEPGR